MRLHLATQAWQLNTVVIASLFIAMQVRQACDCSAIPKSTPVLQTQVVTCGGVEATPALQFPQPQVVRDYQALAIALPIALITILITAALVGVGVALCIRGSVRKKEPR